MLNKRKIIFILVMFFGNIIYSQNRNEQANLSNDNLLTPFRLALPNSINQIKYIDLDDDGDPDVLQTVLQNGAPIQWIDDDDDMKEGDIEGDMDSDCLMIDRNKDGLYGSEHDLILDWNDEDGDNLSDLQVLVDYSGFDDRGLWQSHYMWFIDTDKDQLFNFIDWNTLKMEGWEHSGRAKFFSDYHGRSLFLKVHANTFNINDLRFNWENPFLFYDPDCDGQTEMTIRYIDDPTVIKGLLPLSENEKINEIKPSVNFTRRITSIQMSIDLDNDSQPQNELDFDMSLKFSGDGFDYSDQVHKYKSIRGLPEADKYFFDPRFRQLEELIYPDHSSGYKLIFDRANWKECWFVFDEDDDCNRWERVEFYEPKDIYKFGSKNGGLDNNPQADVTGDRGEWDLDFSGNGQLYIGKFDGLIHLFGAEWGAWRIDQNAKYYQGWQGWRGKNLQPEDLVFTEPEIAPIIKYSDTDNNGFFDLIEYDLDGNQVIEPSVNLLELGIEDSSEIIDISKYDYSNFNTLYKKVANGLWEKAKNLIQLSKENNLNYFWYASLLNPKSDREKYHNGYWLSFYLNKDLEELAKQENDNELLKKLKKVYYSTY